MLSPGALHRAAGEEIVALHNIVQEKVKKGRKRKPRSASQGAPPPTIAQDGPVDKPRMPVHVAGTGMMNPQLLAVATPHMHHLHHACLYIEERRIRDKDESYNVFKVKVPEVPGFVTDVPADIFYVRHSDIYHMLQGIRLHDTLVRLYSLNAATGGCPAATSSSANPCILERNSEVVICSFLVFARANNRFVILASLWAANISSMACQTPAAVSILWTCGRTSLGWSDWSK